MVNPSLHEYSLASLRPLELSCCFWYTLKAIGREEPSLHTAGLSERLPTTSSHAAALAVAFRPQSDTALQVAKRSMPVVQSPDIVLPGADGEPQ